MNILLSAYACNPYKGSEPGIGWNWAVNLHKQGYCVTVITRRKNKKDIEDYICKNSNLQQIKFLYYDLNHNFLKFKKFMGIYIYYELWQIGILSYLKKNIRPNEFDLVHHLTFGVFRQPSHLYKLGYPFIMGPLGGGETAPKELMINLPFKHKFVEFIRYKINSLSLKRPSLKKCYNKADIIFTRTKETYFILPNSFKTKTKIVIDIGVYENEIRAYPKTLNENKTINVLYVGRLIYWKGVHLAVKAFYKFNQQHPNSVFTIVGEGEYKKELINIVKNLNLEKNIIFKGWVSHIEVKKDYDKADIFLFPSLHDAGPLVIVEALKNGLPIVALNLGGVGELLTTAYPTLIKLNHYHENDTIRNISDSLLKLSKDNKFYELTSKKGLDIIIDNTWEKTVKKVYTIIEKNIALINN